jgi:hypothetical protein
MRDRLSLLLHHSELRTNIPTNPEAPKTQRHVAREIAKRTDMPDARLLEQAERD